MVVSRLSMLKSDFSTLMYVLQFLAVLVPHILVEGVERRRDAPVLLEFQDIGVHRASQLAVSVFVAVFVLAFPERQQQCLDTVLLLHVEHLVVRVERVERDGLLLRVGEVDAVLPVCAGGGSSRTSP